MLFGFDDYESTLGKLKTIDGYGFYNNVRVKKN